MSHFLWVETGLRNSQSHSRTTFMVTVSNHHSRGQFKPTLADLRASFQEHLKKIVKENSPLNSMTLRTHPIWLATSDKDVFDLGYDSNWKRLESFTDESLMKLLVKCMQKKRMLKSCLMSVTERDWLKQEREKEILRNELERLRHEEISSLLRAMLLPERSAQIPRAESQISSVNASSNVPALVNPPPLIPSASIATSLSANTSETDLSIPPPAYNS